MYRSTVTGNRFEPSVLQWAREKSEMSIEVLAAKLGAHLRNITPELIQKWENGTETPTTAQIKKLSEIYKRPLAVFFLASPPEEKALPPDRRTIGSRAAHAFSTETLLVIRKARRVQQLAEELEEELGTRKLFKYQKYEVNRDPVALAANIREDLSVTLAEQLKFSTYSDFFEYLRAKIEDTGVITLRSGGTNSFPREDARALSFTDKQPYVILINNKDTEGAKNFSLLHEFAHVLTREAGICNDFTSFSSDGEKIDRLEVFCNRFAAHFLVPEKDFLAHSVLVGKSRIAPQELDFVVKTLAMAFKVSRFVVLRRLLTSDLVTSEIYREKTEKWEKEKPPVRTGGRSVPARTAILNNGITFSSLVFDAYKRDKLSYATASDYLGMKAKHIPTFEKLLRSYGR
jgi:Zn-dependent peptidase ImmA (M78 family)/DNA-binding transcriptional regulator YiaG